MSNYLFIQSQDPFTEVRTEHQFALAGQLFDAGHNVQILLVQNGVIPARQGARSQHLDQLIEWGVPVLADDFSLQQRQISDDDLKDNIAVDSVDSVIDALLDGHKVIWN
ncbi:DsrE/DsrF family oxidoreductase family protein [Alcanivorax hongdengensis A-11-3]|uniref:DsrE/DsrF family oxidoreductase family protein n=1 Tax=Alcanivorax hongdengensis A-11-3 TaxID=1177179 RepID=L0WBB7_9GAMM|nr:DsrE family protein [Alcanivorax hongdengensis]EKF73015.1 DsrE/DsrF family oxidoreductase family protein [Alcanivorax hongdengensis A-11-3]